MQVQLLPGRLVGNLTKALALHAACIQFGPYRECVCKDPPPLLQAGPSLVKEAARTNLFWQRVVV